jgi:hypothetical protein
MNEAEKPVLGKDANEFLGEMRSFAGGRDDAALF